MNVDVKIINIMSLGKNNSTMKIEYNGGRYHGFYRGFHLVKDSQSELISALFKMLGYKKFFIDDHVSMRKNALVLGLPKFSELGEVALSINK